MERREGTGKGNVMEHLEEKEDQETGVLAVTCKKFSEGNQWML